jgi:hypothetical protein
MLREYSKIIPSTEAIHKGDIVPWKGEEKGQYYVIEISVDCPCLPPVKDP